MNKRQRKKQKNREKNYLLIGEIGGGMSFNNKIQLLQIAKKECYVKPTEFHEKRGR